MQRARVCDLESYLLLACDHSITGRGPHSGAFLSQRWARRLNSARTLRGEHHHLISGMTKTSLSCATPLPPG